MAPPDQSELRAYKLTASVLLIRVADMNLDGGGRRVEKIMPGRDDGYASSSSRRSARPVALTFENEPRTELMDPESLTGFDGRPVTGKLLHVCQVVSRLPRELLVDLALEDRESPLRVMADMDKSKAEAFAYLVGRRVSERRTAAEELSSIHKWRAAVAEFESSYRFQPSVAREPYFPLAGWGGAGEFDAVKMAQGSTYYRKGETWQNGTAKTFKIGEPASAVEKILAKLPCDVVVDLHETYPGDPLRQVLAMGPEKAVAFASYLDGHFEQVKTVFTWIKALKNFEVHWREGTCYSANVEDGAAAAWVSRAVEQVYRRSGGNSTLEAWAQGMRAAFDRSAAQRVTAADVAAFASGKEVLRDSRVESVKLVGNNVRVVLKEPIFARIIKHGGRTWREDDDHVGKIMKQWPIAAFDMIYSGNGQFPNAYAYANKDCTEKARHANIHEGKVCMGDLAQGEDHHSTGTLNDFLRMLMMWNLDSAYEKQASVLLTKPAPMPEGQSPSYWVAWQPGLVEIVMGFQALPTVNLAGPGMGTVEEVLD